jgi:hypothetical protein
VLGQLIQHGAGRPLGAEHFGPFVERQIAGDHRCNALVRKTDGFGQWGPKGQNTGTPWPGRTGLVHLGRFEHGYGEHTN